ncbi:hypothetical protein [Hyalangium versicolor]|uniref:hypothetical protein n=1 Tax=Hyalangium versicolor TaxID=2861190 RepID=UPI001CCF66E4|nr:hypothetical protein [Hyalangium versicolor]
MSFPAHPPLRSAARTRLLALPFVALCAVVYLGSAVHFALVQHSTCLEHGEVIHVDELRAIAQPAEVEVAFTDERVARSSQGVTLSHGAEAHCTHAFLRREGLAPSASILLAPEKVAEVRTTPSLEQLVPEPVARLRLAPKSSPPLV